MEITGLMANLTVSDLDRSRAWYAALTGREPHAAPMDGLLEWRFGGGGITWGFQVHAEPERAGRGGVVLRVDDMTATLDGLDAAGITHDAPFDATESRLLTLADPDDNRVVISAPFAT